jgi:hypothetical protein
MDIRLFPGNELAIAPDFFRRLDGHGLGTPLDSLQEYRLGYRERAVRVTKTGAIPMNREWKQQIPKGNDGKQNKSKEVALG